jgi:putative lipoprotein
MLRTNLGIERLALLAGAFFAAATPVLAQSIQGTATYRERVALPPDAIFDAVVEDVSRADAPAVIIAATRVTSPGNPPIAFTVDYDAAKISDDRRYVIRASVLVGGKLLFATDTATPVITRGAPLNVSLMMRMVAATTTSPPAAAGGRSVEGTYWRAIELAGKPTPAQDPKREAHLVFQAGGRVTGSDGCNRITGGYQRQDDALTFGQIAGTRMACPDSAEIEGAFQAALKATVRFRVASDRLELLDASGTRVAAFVPGTQASSPQGR